MHKIKLFRAARTASILSFACAGVITASAAAYAQIVPKPSTNPNELQVYLVRQDFSDCSNANVPSGDSPNVGGNVWIVRGSDGNTNIKVAMTASPNTTYHFFLKCVRLLGDIKTDDEGSAIATFSYKTSEVGNVYGFDSYPEGAPAGNKFQSAQVKFQ